MSEKRQEETCAICLGEILVENEVKLDSCMHKYCGACIKQWVETQTNSCPQCKKKVHKIISKDSLGRDKVTKVKDKSMEPSQEEDEEFECEQCGRVIPPANFRVGHRNEG